jgi:hypothetical protein
MHKYTSELRADELGIDVIERNSCHKLHPPLNHKNIHDISPYSIDTLVKTA